MDDNNIFLLDQRCILSERPQNYEKVKREIIKLLKESNFSLSRAGCLFKDIIYTLGDTPLDEL